MEAACLSRLLTNACVFVTLRPELSARSNSCEKGAAADGKRTASQNHLEAFSSDTTDIVSSANWYAAAEATLDLAGVFVQQSKQGKKKIIK